MSVLAPTPLTAPPAAPPPSQAPRVIAWTRTCAAALLGLAAIVLWWPVLGAGALWILPILALTAAVAGGVIELRDSRLRFVFPWLWLLWTPVALLLAGLPAWTLDPTALGITLREMAEALRAGITDPAPSDDPWMLAAWLHTCGLFWFLGAGWARRSARGAVAAAFFLFAAPFALPLAFGGAADAAWQGGIIIVGGLLWATRGNLRDGLPALAVVAVVGVIVAAAVAPRERWAGLDQRRGAPFSTLDARQTYGPPADRKTGATMFEIRAERPSLWRTEVLEGYDGSVWKIDRLGDELPQPAAVRRSSTVTIEGLRNEQAVAPGRILEIGGGAFVGSTRRPGTEAVLLSAPPRSGQSYSVVSEEVPISAALRDIEIPEGPQYRRLTSVYPNPAAGPLPATLQQTPPGRVAAMAEGLAAGTRNQLTVVRRVQALLVDSGQYRYSLDVGQPGAFPLIDFLLNTRTGYCQHFAGAAALLLRMNGIPARVAVGFATGVPVGDGLWRVRDLEAHAWTEVYFPGQGWVAFDMTPPAEAQVAQGVGQSTPDDDAAGVSGVRIPVPIVLGVLAVLGLALLAWWWRTREPRAPEALGEVLARIVPAPAEPGMTFAELREDLRELGPSVAALADQAERERFGPPGSVPAERHPRRRVWRALLADVGVWRTARIVLLGPGRRPITKDFAPKVSSARPPSVAPPPS